MKASVAALAFALLITLHPSNSWAEQNKYIVIDPTSSAPLRSEPNGKKEMTRIPASSILEVFQEKDSKSGKMVQTWYQVEYKGQKGWVSQYVTNGWILIKDSETGKFIDQKPISYMNSPRMEN